MRLSIIIPAFNEAERIVGCLEALLGQSRPGVEVIVADDGSTDGTADLVARRFPYVRVLRLGHREGVAARNAAIAEARSPRIAFLDADCVPCAGWVDAVLAGEGDPAVRMGRVVPEPTFLSRLVALLEFGEFLALESREIRNFALLNVSGPADLFRRNPFPEVAIGTDRLHSWRLGALGHTIRYDPAQAVVHRPRTTAAALLRRHMSYARRFVLNRRREPGLPGGRLARAGPLAAPLLAAGRLACDLDRLVRGRGALGVSRASLVLYALAALGARVLDSVVMMASPDRLVASSCRARRSSSTHAPPRHGARHRL